MLLVPMGKSRGGCSSELCCISWCWVSLLHAQKPDQPGGALPAAYLLLLSRFPRYNFPVDTIPPTPSRLTSCLLLSEETTFEAGVKVQIHSQSEPPFVQELGFGVAPGFQTFVATQEQRVSPRFHLQTKVPPMGPKEGFHLCADAHGEMFSWLRAIFTPCFKLAGERTIFSALLSMHYPQFP